MASEFSRDLKRQVTAVIRSTQSELDALLERAEALTETALRAEVAHIFARNGLEAPVSEVDRCTAGLLSGERVELSYE